MMKLNKETGCAFALLFLILWCAFVALFAWGVQYVAGYFGHPLPFGVCVVIAILISWVLGAIRGK